MKRLSQASAAFGAGRRSTPRSTQRAASGAGTLTRPCASVILEPEAVVFANLIAIAACSADCVASSVGFGFAELFWCSGCNGPVYPMNGNVAVHVGGVEASSLLNHRLLGKMHRLGYVWQWHGASALCNGHPNPLMDKPGYKTQMLYPVPMTSGTDGSGPNRCCQPLESFC